jgi:hypothetical protein
VVNTRRRAPLKVVSHSLTGRPRHRAPYEAGPVKYVVEVFPERDWASLHPAERPWADTVAFLPGIGYVSLDMATDEEYEEVCAENAAAKENRKAPGRI